MLKRISNVFLYLGMAVIAGALAIRFGRPDTMQYGVYLAWAGIACLVISAAANWQDIVGVFSKRQARYGTLTGVSVLVVLAILVGVNYVGKRQNKRWDL